jgi:hypothetical protein
MTLTHLDRLTLLLRQVGASLPSDLLSEVRDLHAEWERTMRSHPGEAVTVLEPKARELVTRINEWFVCQPGVVTEPLRYAYQR